MIGWFLIGAFLALVWPTGLILVAAFALYKLWKDDH